MQKSLLILFFLFSNILAANTVIKNNRYGRDTCKIKTNKDQKWIHIKYNQKVTIDREISYILVKCDKNTGPNAVDAEIFVNSPNTIIIGSTTQSFRRIGLSVDGRKQQF